MSENFEQFFLLPITSPGSLAYHALLAFTVLGALVNVLSSRHAASGSTRRRMTVGLCSILCIQCILFVVSGLVWQGLLGAENLMPVLDRAVGLLSLLIIAWMWAYPTTNRLADAFAALLGLLLVALSAYALVWWQGQQPVDTARYFNGSAADELGSWTALGLILIGLFILIVRRPHRWEAGLGMLLGLAGGYILHWLLPQPEYDFSGPIRLAAMAFYPLLLALPQRYSTSHQILAPDTVPVVVERPAFSQDLRAQQALVSLSQSASPTQFYQDLASSMAQLIKADICLLTLPQLNDRYLIFSGGYNRLSDSQLDGFSLEQRRMPALVDAYAKRQLLHLPAGSTAPDLVQLASALNLERVGAVLSAPIANPDEQVMLGIVLLGASSDQTWSEADQRYLADAAQAFAPLVQRVQQGGKMQEELEQFRLRMAALNGDATQAVSENSQLITRLEILQNELADEKQRSTSLAALVTQHAAEHEPTAAQPELPIQEAPRQVDAPETEQLQSDLRLVLEELAGLRQSLAQADQTILELKAEAVRAAAAPQSNERDVIVSIAQELRQPMSSIMGYTDLLLGESVGLLGAMQRKFLERVKASTERMGGLLEELIQVSSQDGEEMSLNPVMVDLNAVIDEAVSSMIAQLSEKNIALRVDLPDELPPIQADLEALQQILSNLLSNASLATPADGEITLRARVEAKENAPSFLLLQVTDQGGGIPPADLPRVFSRLYRADNVLIQGIGDTGVGLAIVKTLVEAHDGRIWVDTEMERGSTFSILLPLSPEASTQDFGAASA